MFSTGFIFRQQENLVDNQKCQAGFRPLCNKILIYNRNIFKVSELCKKCLPWWWVRWEQDIEDDIRYWRFAIVPFDRVCRLDRSWFWCPMHNKGLARPRSHHMTWIKEEHFVKKVLSVNLSCYRPLWNLYLIWDQRDFAEKVHILFALKKCWNS